MRADVGNQTSGLGLRTSDGKPERSSLGLERKLYPTSLCLNFADATPRSSVEMLTA